MFRFMLSLLLLLSSWNLVQAQVMEPGPKSPQESLKCIKVRPGFKVELMATEPLVQDPIACAWGPDGKFWVVEMGDYPLGLDGKGKPGGNIKFLTKSREDGPYDKATLFLGGLGFPTGVTPWKKGVLITCAPNILYAEDTDGDGKADKVAILYSGFGEGNQQHRVNGLVYGLDNWFYGANGDSGGKVKSGKTGEVLDIRGRDFRIKPDEGLIEAQSGQTQYGRSRDDWGNWFGNMNVNPMWHFVLDDHYLKRNPHVLYPDPRVNVSIVPGASRVYPISKEVARFNNPQDLNHFTSVCCAMIYRDNLFGKDFEGNSFVCEPTHNLVHREIVSPKGLTFTSRRADDEKESEFLASSDYWFRPVWLQTGPDGALWVVDMYRYVIEHPQWIPLDWQKKLDLRAGHDMGRIYRVYPEDKKPRAIPRIDQMRAQELVAVFDSPNGWTRDMAQQRLVEEKEESALKPLRQCLNYSNNPLARLHAFCSLIGFKKVMGEDMVTVLGDKHPGVLRNTIPYCFESNYATRFADIFLAKLPKDPDPPICLQLAYSLAHQPYSVTGHALGQLLCKQGNDKYILAAGLSSLNKENWPFVFAKILEEKNPPPILLTKLMQIAPVFGEPNALARLLSVQVASQKDKNIFEQFVYMTTLVEALEKNRNSLAKLWQTNPDGDLRTKLEPLKEIFTTARNTVQDPKAPLGDKMLALKLLGRGFDQQDEDRKLLASLLVPQLPEDIQGAAIQRLGEMGDFQVAYLLLKPWKSFNPNLRNQVMDVLLTRTDWTRLAIQALERKEVLPHEVNVTRREKFLDHRDPLIRRDAEIIFTKSSQPERDKVVEQYLLTVLATKGNAAAGNKLFVKHCAACHKLGGVGEDVGPELAAVKDKTPQGLLTAILDPNRAVESRYVNYVAVTMAGLTLSGLIAAETSTSITLVSADGKKHDILRKDLEEFASTGKSAMPEGFEKDISPAEVVDLIAFLRSEIPQPPTARPEKDGSLHLLAQNASIIGKKLVLEKQYGNLGMWTSREDKAAWAIEIPKEGVYTVCLHYACPGGNAGNPFRITLGTRSILAKVPATLSWDDYRRINIGDVRLPPGQYEVQMEPSGLLRGALLDLKEIQLVPHPD